MKKVIYAEETEKGYILHVKYSLWGVVFYRKEKHIGNKLIDYSDF